MSKQYLGLGDYQLLRYRGIERYLCLVLIAYLLLTHLALRELDAQAKRGKRELRLSSIPQLQDSLRRKLWDDAIDGLASGKRYKAVARKIKDFFNHECSLTYSLSYHEWRPNYVQSNSSS